MFLLHIILNLVIILSATQSNFDDHMVKGLQHFNRMEYAQAKEEFTIAAHAAPNSWYAPYYIAQIELYKMQNSQNYEEMKVALENAKKYINIAKKLSSENSEIICLEAYYFGGLIQLNPQQNGIKYIDTVSSLYGKALGLNPTNLRAKVGLLSFNIGKAKFMGLDYDAECEQLKEIIMDFDHQEQKEQYDPLHGKNYALFASESCQ